jgi:hypothetical protein
MSRQSRISSPLHLLARSGVAGLSLASPPQQPERTCVQGVAGNKKVEFKVEAQFLSQELVDNRQCALAAAACEAAAEEGHLEALACLHSRGSPWNVYTSNRAAAGGHLEVLRYVHGHGCP